ncbi:High-affinity branched-chain amino acid transport system permease protein LivH [bioreactor metagenome]|uniref:High-affinity branched-chain amino acid transport system permease protein LivH n=1 Tax=bioreactor metagenome TaxID=1076179 RepID=A0A644ZT29_9ZZZZ
MFWQIIINGLTLGCVYAMVALGYSMVYGVLQIVNWAHADVLMIGTFIAVTLATVLKLPALAIVLLAAGATAVIGMSVERLAYRTIKSSDRKLAVLVSALGMSTFLRNLAQLVWGSGTSQLTLFPKVSYRIGGVGLTNIQIIILGVTILMLAVLYVLVYKTKMGVAMRACSTSIPNAKLMGINTNGVISMTFGIGAFMAGIGGLCIGSYYNAVYSTMGYMLGMKAFAAAILGGIGSLPGAVLGGFVMGLVECLGAGYISTGYQDAYAFIVLFVILTLRPSGILGAKHVDKV